MTNYQTDEEKVEAIKKWWQENGKSVIAGIVLGAAGIAGWQGWQGHQRTQGEAASMYFDAMRQALRAGETDLAEEQGRQLLGSYAKSAYAGFAALEMARLAYARGEKAAARGHLRWVVDSDADAAVRELARLRLGHVLLDMDDLDALQELLTKPSSAAFAGEFAALRGDLEVARGNAAAAREAYRDALALGVGDEGTLRMKWVDVGGGNPTS